MTTDQQVRILMKALNSGGLSLEAASAKAGISMNAGRRYRRLGLAPSQTIRDHKWRTRRDPFEDFSAEIEQLLNAEPSLEAKTLFEHLQRTYPDRLPDGQLRSLQRRVKIWRATKGPDLEVFFEQEHFPGDIGASDFCHADRLGITIAGQFFSHLAVRGCRCV